MPQDDNNQQQEKAGKDPVSGTIDTVNNVRNAVQGIRGAIQGVQAIGSAVSTFPVWGPILGIIIAGAALIIILVVLVAYLLGFIGGGTANADNGGGNPNIPPGAPRGCPIKGTITTPFGTNIPGYSFNGGRHDGVDISDGVYDSPVYSTLAGIAQPYDSPTGNHEVIVTSNDNVWQVTFLHLEAYGRVSGPVNVGQIIGLEDNSGVQTTGSHVHYEIRFFSSFVGAGELKNPLLYMPVSLNFTIPAGDDYSSTPVPSVGWGTCNTLPQDTPLGGTNPDGSLNFYILYGDTTIGVDPSVEANIKSAADLAWPDNNINKTICPGTGTCWDWVIAQSIASGISPAFSIAVWQEEGGYGGIVNGGRAADQFGMINCSSHDIVSSFNCFISFTAAHPYNPANQLGSFTEWLSYFCGPNQPTICGNNPNTLRNLPVIYNDIAPGKIVYVTP